MHRGLQLLIALSVSLGGIATAVRAQDKTDAKQGAQTQGAAGATGSSPKSATADPNYLIGPQDILDIIVWKEQELTRNVPVRPDGKISLPLLNDVQAAGLTPMQLSMRITASLRKYVADPQVTVVVTQINSQRIYILGEVNRAGAYPLLPGMTVLEALSSSGGFTIFANTKKIYVLRKAADGTQAKLPFNYKNVIHGKAPEQNIPLEAGDTIVVP
jgi:polysaccharide biosynthesis/export protein